jgi:DDE family transposase
VGAGEVWVADRNFCTTAFLEGLVERAAHSLVREHGLLRFTPLEAMRPLAPEGEGVRALSEQWVQLKPQRDGRCGLKLRRIKVELDRPTRHGEAEVYLLSTVGPEVADAATLARLYRQRWSIERAFLHLTTELRCEVHTLSYPPAALFALACAVVAFNVLAVLKAALRAAHGAEVEQTLSSHAMASDLRNMGQSLEVIVDAQDWAVFRLASLAAMAAWLLDQARRVSLRRYAKAPSRTKPAKPAVKRVHDPKKPHVALSRLLAAQKAAAP